MAKRPRNDVVTSTDLLLQQGLHIRHPVPTADFYRHVYINSAYRADVATPSSDVECTLATPITVPDDGTTTICLHRASIPWTFNNIRINAKATLKLYNGNGVVATNAINIPEGFYTGQSVQTLIIAQLTGSQFQFDISAAGNSVFQRTTANAGEYITVEFEGSSTRAGPTKAQLNKTAANIFGWNPTTTNKSNTSGAISESVTLISPYVFAPIRDFEIQVRIAGLPIDPSMIDMVMGGTSSNIIAVLPIDVSNRGDVITAERENQIRIPIARRSKIYKLQAYITFADQELVNLNGSEWSAVFSIEKKS
jgi:hypothetical protein